MSATIYQEFADTHLATRGAPKPQIGRVAGEVLDEMYIDVCAAFEQCPAALASGAVAATSTAAGVVPPSAVRSMMSSVPPRVRASLAKYKYVTHAFTMRVGPREVDFAVAVRHSARLSRKYVLEHFAARVFALCSVMLPRATNKECTASKLVIFIAATECRKTFPDSKDDVITTENANTAFTYGCDPLTRRAETPVLVFREEEWFKVLAHELCHAAGLDFSELHADRVVSDIVDTKLKTAFNVRSVHIKLYETYCETWATVINALFSVAATTGGARRGAGARIAAALEREARWSLFQMSKLLRKYNTTYLKFTSATPDEAAAMDEHDVALFSYNIAKAIAVTHVGEFVEWCAAHGADGSAMQFTNDYTTVESFCAFIRDRHCSSAILKYTTELDKGLAAGGVPTEVLETMRMSVTDW
jgi:hypothetical protein